MVSTSTAPRPRRPEASSQRQISSADETTFERASQLLSLALDMRSGLKSHTYDRRWRNLKVYKQCFLHSDAVEWMTEYLQSSSESSSSPQAPETAIPESIEELAVSKLNDLIDAGYVHHVCNEHRFVVNEPATLYFRFQNANMEADMRSIRRRKAVLGELYGGVSSVISEETASLNLAVDRLSSNLEKSSQSLDDAHGRILLLEEAVSALAFALTSIIYSFAALALYHSALTGDRGVTNLSCIALNSVILLFGAICFLARGPRYAYESVFEHAAALLRLARLGDNVEDAFMGDISGSDSMEYVSTDEVLPILQKEDSVLEKLRSRFSLPATREVPIRARDYRSLPAPTDWPHHPVLVCANSDAQPDLAIPIHGRGPVPLGKAFSFESDLFEGTCLIRLRGVPSDDAEGDAEYFLGRRRKFQAIVQGRFKEPLKVSDVLTGHEFVRPLKGLPPPWVLSAGVNLIKRLAPGANIVLHEEQPRALAILAATSQSISADMPGNEPDITCNQIEEDVSLLGGIFKRGDVSSAGRKRHLAAPERAERYVFDTESIYTFDFYQNILDTATYSLDLGFTKLGMAKVLDGQPIQVLAKTADGRDLWNFQIWHEMLVPKDKKKRRIISNRILHGMVNMATFVHESPLCLYNSISRLYQSVTFQLDSFSYYNSLSQLLCKLILLSSGGARPRKLPPSP